MIRVATKREPVTVTLTGPYAGVNCTLTLLKSSIRTTPVVGDDYARADAEDTRFSDYFGSLQSIVTSSGQNDSGLFETAARQARVAEYVDRPARPTARVEEAAVPETPARFMPGNLDVPAFLRRK